MTGVGHFGNLVLLPTSQHAALELIGAKQHLTFQWDGSCTVLFFFEILLHERPPIGALLMSISTVIVAVNAMLLRRFDLTRGALTIDQEALPAHG